MIYRFLLLSDEIENFERIIEIDSEATFLEFREAILKSVGYSDTELTSFYICSYDWEREQEILFIEMDSDSSVDTYLMDNTKLDDFLEDEGQRLMFIFDMLTDRAFFIELKEVIVGKSLDTPKCVVAKGNPPVQSIQFDEILDDVVKKGNNLNIFDDDLYGDNLYNEDEFDPDGFSDLTFDER
ncbi:MAG: hypothetical protein Q4A56_09070 [Porphyromonadaceae bacterium]|nr:hypothetical protein [Porphyromonadaceae bacterium]